MKKLRKIIVGLMLLGVIIGVYSTYIEGKLLTSKKYGIEVNKNWKENIKVVQFTDTQLGEFFSLDQLQKVVDRINSEKADIVVFSGDLIDNASKYEDLYKISGVLAQIQASKGKYAIYGNHDYGGGAVRYYNEIMEESGFKILVNESDKIELESTTINIFGLDDALMGDYNKEETMGGISNKDVNLLLIHEPDLIDDFKEYPIDLALAGHSHGGQVYIPFYGPIKTTALAEKYTKGFYKIHNENKGKLYVNSGLGNTKVPFRLFNIPQITVINLKI
ncbi:metallophosphoesterase [Clostridium gasigenes]|uniref:metallophosphoesterase n=1 Tax=Clostridium gasigenes TaxID=94869 RepID=UPI001C0D0491|nr:metallophosphoesterase [Clostridium gasigenes]MBU3103757.1 metallophosphoesterase [Clostridium gasigenes]